MIILTIGVIVIQMFFIFENCAKISWSVCPDKLFQASLVFVSTARAYPSEASYGSILALIGPA